MPTIALKSLLQARHMHGYSEFVAEYRRHAKALELPVMPEPPTKAHYYKWVAGQVKGLPRGPHCLVLEHMFPGWTVERLFAPSDFGIARVDEPSEELVPGLSAMVLSGLWVTVYRVEDVGCHVDLTRLTAVSGHRVTGQNWPPEPRCEKGHAGYRNEIEAEVSQRHLIGRWRNRRDSYYFGTVHLAVLPGETILDGFYTANAADVAVAAEPWKWMRISESEVGEADLGKLQMKAPEQVYALVQERSRLDPPLGLADITE
ncbi:hypothetical protein GPX89_07595 [Nocardia sp. ET3-3]|uniref:Uncharacterized protein n=1 Tax=Nocardia terrae TaxID=2675851 RepID=A0A7K1URY2_9NOCA|nr:hypothetical protein [Nocardia terrae]MVU77110.1 hypothetical protein [Nocardia terrae]